MKNRSTFKNSVFLTGRNAVRAAALFFCLAASFIAASCDFGFDGNSFQNKAGAYFKEMTSTAAISSYDIEPKDYLTNSRGIP
ncbi:MAG: hypothetical protein J6V90_10635, partial [Treponema sp.]|nr:hypothetical protein [Treponema sp.]